MAAGHIAGFYHALFCLRDSSGYPFGTLTDPDNAANGTTTHAHKLIAPVEASALTFERESAAFRGGQTLLGRRQLGISDIGAFEITLSAFDEAFHALISGSAVDTSIASANSVTTPNALRADPPQGMLLLTLGFQTTAGVNKYITYAYPNVQISEASAGAASQDGGENPLPTRYTVTVSRAERTIFGLPYSATALDAADDADLFVRYVTAKPVSVTTYKAAAGATTFTLGYRPASSDHAGVRNVWTKNGAGAHADVTGVNTTTGAVTINAAGAGDVWVAVYETDFATL
ncbi:MAG: hypothetical protein IAE80_10260 [Anaerolinea sp.]|nr:hypothetical protein [Anaerolinea sp.]